MPKSGFLTKNEFVNLYKDGVLLGRLANKYQPGAAEAVKEGEEAKQKENQVANLNVFNSLAKQYVSEDQLITFEDFEKGKESYPKIFSTLFKLALVSSGEQFKVPGANFEQFKSEIEAVSNQKFLQNLVSKLHNATDYISTLIRRPVNLFLFFDNIRL